MFRHENTPYSPALGVHEYSECFDPTRGGLSNYHHFTESRNQYSCQNTPPRLQENRPIYRITLLIANSYESGSMTKNKQKDMKIASERYS
jgi:hypothetical protein